MDAILFEDVNLEWKQKIKREGFETPGNYLKEAPLAIYPEQTTNSVEFNVLPGAKVKEKLFIKEYKIWDQYMEATFDRKYTSQMTKSPDHLIFISALVHLQKMMYVYVTHKLGFSYDPCGPEKVKFWPTNFNIDLTGMVRKKENLVQKMFVEGIVKKEKSGGYEIFGYSKIGDHIYIEGRSPFFIIGDK